MANGFKTLLGQTSEEEMQPKVRTKMRRKCVSGPSGVAVFQLRGVLVQILKGMLGLRSTFAAGTDAAALR